MPHLLFALGTIAAALAWALMEIQIEGRSGWAANLPTWRFENAWTRRILGARPVTGYHFYIQWVVAILAHLAYFLGVHPSWALELRILAFLIFFWNIEDFLWFVFNPAYGIRRFRRQEIWWHAHSWWGFMPRDYWLTLPVALLLYVLSWRIG